MLKRDHLEKHPLDNGKLNGSKWYSLEAIRAVNQALGRVIRHAKDYGMIILADERFNYG